MVVDGAIRVLIVDDDAFVRTAVSAVLGQISEIVVVGECGDGAEVPSLAGQVRPDVVLMDVHMPVVSGLEATRALLSGLPEVRVLMWSGAATPATINNAVRVGAMGFLLKSGDLAPLVDAILAVAAGGTAWPDK